MPVEQEIPEELKATVAREVESGEASLRGHLKSEGADTDNREESGSSSYMPEHKSKDTQLQQAIDLLRGASPSASGVHEAEARELRAP
jgi:carboxyl-terminal processing protease